jgi:hypothetical protein
VITVSGFFCLFSSLEASFFEILELRLTPSMIVGVLAFFLRQAKILVLVLVF